jgi:hypothetical protein
MAKRLYSINEIFKKDKNGDYVRSNALLAQYIFRYASLIKRDKSGYSEPFLHWELAKWLVKTFPDFVEYYEYPPHNHTSPSNRIENTRQRTIGLLDDLISLGLIEPAGTAPQRRGTGITKCYKYTISGYLIAWLIEIKNKDEERKSKAIRQLLDMIDACNKINDSYILLFITRFFRKCNEKRVFDLIVTFYLDKILWKYTLNNDRDLLLLVFGLRHTLNWLLAEPQIFCETLRELDQDAKQLVLFHFKMEIEEYYNENYLKESILITRINNKAAQLIRGFPNINSDYLPSLPVPGREWQVMRFHNIHDYSKVILPGFCDTCKSEQPFVVDIFTYFDYIISAYGPYPKVLVSGNCIKCNKYTASTDIMRFPHFGTAWT